MFYTYSKAIYDQGTSYFYHKICWKLSAEKLYAKFNKLVLITKAKGLR